MKTKTSEAQKRAVANYQKKNRVCYTLSFFGDSGKAEVLKWRALGSTKIKQIVSDYINNNST